MKQMKNYIDKIENKNVKHNVRLFPLYYMFAEDFLFFYAIEFIFLTQIKGFSYSQVLLLDSMIPLFCVLFNIPSTLFVERIGKRRALVIGNFCMCICLELLMVSKSFAGVIIAFLFNALGFSFKGLTETNILAESINMKSKEGKTLFGLAYSTGIKNYCILDGVTSFFIGLTFTINGYLPIVISLVFTMIATYLSACFKKTELESKEKNKDKEIKRQSFIKEYKKELKNLKSSFIKFFKSRRLRSLMLFILFFSGFKYGSFSIRETLLTDYFEVNATTFGIILASLTIISGVAELLYDRIKKIFTNRTLTFLSMTFILTYFLIYGIVVSNLNGNVKLALILILFGIQYSIDSLYMSFENTYQKNFTTNKIRVKISSIIDIIRYVSNFCITFTFSVLVNKFEIVNSYLYIAIGSFVIFSLVLLYMRKRFGLKPSQYKKSEIFAK